MRGASIVALGDLRLRLRARSVRIHSLVRLVLHDLVARALLPVDVPLLCRRVLRPAPYCASLWLRKVVLELLLAVDLCVLPCDALRHNLVEGSVAADAPSVVRRGRPRNLISVARFDVGLFLEGFIGAVHHLVDLRRHFFNTHLWHVLQFEHVLRGLVVCHVRQ